MLLPLVTPLNYGLASIQTFSKARLWSHRCANCGLRQQRRNHGRARFTRPTIYIRPKGSELWLASTRRLRRYRKCGKAQIARESETMSDQNFSPVVDADGHVL